MNKKIERTLKGAKFSWSAFDPLAATNRSGMYNTIISHKNPASNVKISKNLSMYREYFLKYPLNWSITITMECLSKEEGQITHEQTLIGTDVVFSDLDEIVNDLLESMFEDIDKSTYITTHTTTQIV